MRLSFTRILTILVTLCPHASLTETPEWLLSTPKANIIYDTNKNSVIQSLSFQQWVENTLDLVLSHCDGEDVDALEHFFWDFTYGTVLELGALSGDNNTSSQSFIFEQLGWNRILIEANPKYRNALQAQPHSFSVNAAVCNEMERKVHYVSSHSNEYVSGVVEFMTPPFLRSFYPRIYHAGHSGAASGKGHLLKNPPHPQQRNERQARREFNITSIDWKSMLTWKNDFDTFEIYCITMDRILDAANAHHIDLFILDVEGAEVSVLKSINWNKTTFDVIIIEKNHPQELIRFFNHTEYKLVTERGRNMWFVHSNFRPSKGPHVRDDCYRGCIRGGLCKNESICN